MSQEAKTAALEVEIKDTNSNNKACRILAGLSALLFGLGVGLFIINISTSLGLLCLVAGVAGVTGGLAGARHYDKKRKELATELRNKDIKEAERAVLKPAADIKDKKNVKWKYCPICGKELPKGNFEFCPFCGNSLKA